LTVAQLHAADYFDLEEYHARLARNRRAWGEFVAGEREVLGFMNLCAPALCDLFGVGYRDYYTDPGTMIDTQLRGIAWRLENLDEDELPQAVFLDQATLHEAIAFDLEVQYRDNAPPWAGRLLDYPSEIDDLAVPSLVKHRTLLETASRLEEMRTMVAGIPVLTSVHLHAPFTMAAQLFGAEELYILCLEEPARAHKLLQFCVDFFQHFERVKWQYGISPDPLDEFVCWRESQQGMTRIWVSDDSAPSVSPKLYREFVLPYNRQLFSGYQFVQLHMDGKWDHLLPLVGKLQPGFVEVGGETDWAAAVEHLGRYSVLQGGIGGQFALERSPSDCFEAATRALSASRGRARAVITVAQETHPGMPLENMQAIIQAVRAWQRKTEKI
jgi:uroporphyrinogen-III decarboxylase